MPGTDSDPVTVPYLSLRDLKEELERFHAQPHRTRTTAFFGRGEAGELTLPLAEGERKFRVVPVRCELELRHELLEDPSEPRVFLLDDVRGLPIDVASRLAGGRVHYVTRARRLERRFGKKVSPAVLRSRLADAVLRLDGTLQVSDEHLAVDLDTAWGLFLKQQAGYEFGAFTEEKLVAFFTLKTLPITIERALAADPALAPEMAALCAERVGPVAAIAWHAWLAHESENVAALAFLFDAAAGPLDGDPYLWGRLVSLLEKLDPALPARVRSQPVLKERWAALAAPLARRLSGPALDTVLMLADQLLADERIADALVDSRHLPRAFLRARTRLAQAFDAALESGAAESGGTEQFLAARHAFERVRDHTLGGDLQNLRLVARALMALRLLGWNLSHRELLAQLREEPSSQALRLLAEDYVRQGGYADHARRLARGAAPDDLGRAINRIVERADTLRDADDKRHAEALRVWSDNGRRPDGVVPIERALDHFAVEFLDGGAHRKLLVLLLDGMSWEAAVQLLLDMPRHGYGPVAWKPRRADRKALLPPMIAALPTTTQVSRAAFFGGRLLSPGETPATAKDPARFEDHRGLRKLVDGGPKLLLERDALAAGGHLAKAALDLVGLKDRVVGIVLNAIDDQLKAGGQIAIEYTLDRIKALSDLLRAATDGDRAVLCVADHGHVPGDRMRSVGKRPGAEGARYRELGEEDAPFPDEQVFSDEGTWRSKTKRRAALLFQETDSYASGGHEGEHGGASLAEVVAPAFLVGHDDLAKHYRADAEDREVEVVTFPRPVWWDLELPAARLSVPVTLPSGAPAPAGASASASATARAADSHKLAAAPPQLPLFDAPAKDPPPAVAPSEWRTLLSGWPHFKSLRGPERDNLERVIGWVELLAEHGGKMPAEVFANRIGVLLFRADGVVSLMSERLNFDGYEVIAYDRPGKQIVLQLDLLRALFGASA